MIRKTLSILGIWLLTATAILAQSRDEMKLKEGSLIHFREQGTAIVSIDLSEAEFGKENVYEEYRNTEEVVLPKKTLDRAISDLCTQFNYQNKGGIQLQDKEADVLYRLEILVSKLNEGSSGGVLNIDDKTSGGAKISGMVKLTDALTGKTLCLIEFYDISSDSKISKKARLTGAFEELGFQLGKLVKQK